MRTIVVACGIALALMAGLVNVNAAKADTPVKTDAEKVRALLKERLETLMDQWGKVLKRDKFVPDKSAWLSDLCVILQEILEVNLELSFTPTDRLSAYKNAVEALKKVENDFKERVDGGTALPQDYLRAKQIRLKVEINMTKEQIKQGAK
jgi:hypothetical protein